MRLRTLAVALLVLPVLLTGCGSKKGSTKLVHTDTTSKAPPSATIDLAVADGKLAFDKKSIKVQAGTVELVLTNDSSTPHAIAIKGHGVSVKGKTVSNGGRSVVQATLKSGIYEFYCPVDGHEKSGMKGQLRVGNKM